MLEPSDEVSINVSLASKSLTKVFRRGAKGGAAKRVAKLSVLNNGFARRDIRRRGRWEAPIDVGVFAEIRAHVRDVFATLDDARSRVRAHRDA